MKEEPKEEALEKKEQEEKVENVTGVQESLNVHKTIVQDFCKVQNWS